MKFIFDNQLSPYLAEASHSMVKSDGHEVTHLRRKFAPSTQDVEWIQSLSKEGGWIVICGDLNIIRTRAERPVWKSSGLTGFFLKKGWINVDGWEQASKLMQWWPKILKQSELATPGSTFFVPFKYTGKFEPV